MKRLRALLGFLFVFAPITIAAQDVVPQSNVYTWASAVSGTDGQMGKYITIGNSSTPRTSNYTIDVSVSGTTPETCVFRVEGSSDGVNWYGLDKTSPSTNDCTASFMESIAYRPVLLMRIYLTYTQGDTTTKVVFHFTGGQ
jgi:hypothetical protein